MPKGLSVPKRHAGKCYRGTRGKYVLCVCVCACVCVCVCACVCVCVCVVCVCVEGDWTKSGPTHVDQVKRLSVTSFWCPPPLPPQDHNEPSSE